MNFDKVMTLAQDLANRSRMELTALTYYLSSQEWIAYFADEKSSSHVKIQDWSVSALLNRIEGNYELDEDDDDEDSELD